MSGARRDAVARVCSSGNRNVRPEIRLCWADLYKNKSYLTDSEPCEQCTVARPVGNSFFYTYFSKRVDPSRLTRLFAEQGSRVSPDIASGWTELDGNSNPLANPLPEHEDGISARKTDSTRLRRVNVSEVSL